MRGRRREQSHPIEPSEMSSARGTRMDDVQTGVDTEGHATETPEERERDDIMKR